MKTMGKTAAYKLASLHDERDFMQITGYDSKCSTSKRQDKTLYTVWFIDTESGLLFDDEQSARTFCLMYEPKAAIIPPIYQ